MKNREPENTEVLRTLVERIPEEIFRPTTIRRQRLSFKEEAEHLVLDPESGEWPKPERDSEEENLYGSRKNGMMVRR